MIYRELPIVVKTTKIFSKTSLALSICIATILNVAMHIESIKVANAASLIAVRSAHLNQDVKVKQIAEDNEVLSIEEEDILLDSDDDEILLREDEGILSIEEEDILLDSDELNYDENFLDEEELLLREDIVMLMQGRNAYGEQVFAYIRLSINDLRLMKYAILNREQFSPFDYGEVIYSGNGVPSQELREEMMQRYGPMNTPSVSPSDLSGEQ